MTNNIDEELIRRIHLACWQEFVDHVSALLGAEKQLLIRDETRLYVAQEILNYGRDAPVFAIHRMVLQSLLDALTIYANPSPPLPQNTPDGDQENSDAGQKPDNSSFKDLTQLARMHAALSVAWGSTTPQRLQDVLVEALAEFGYQFSQYVNLSALYKPEFYKPIAAELNAMTLSWLKGHTVTKRADEVETRVHYCFDLMELEPRLARLAANNVLRLPPGHPARDEERIRKTLNVQLKRAIDQAAEPDMSVEQFVSAADLTLSMMAGLIEHEIVSPTRIDGLMTAASSLLQSPHLTDEGNIFRHSAMVYNQNQAAKARKSGETELAAMYDAKVVDLLTLLIETETDPGKKQIYSLLRSNAAGQSEEVEELFSTAAVAIPEPAQSETMNLLAVRHKAKRAFERQQYREVIELLSPIQQKLEEQYLAAVLEEDIATTGKALAEALAQLAFAYTHEDHWEKALTVLDRAKSLRFRYQALLRSSPLGDELRQRETEIYKRARGIGPLGATPLDLQRSLTALLEAYRKEREKIDLNELQSASPAEISARLDSDEAVVVLGVGPTGMLLTIIRPGGDGRPAAHHLLSSEEFDTFRKSLIDWQTGWFIFLGFGPAFAEPRNSLQHLLDTVDRILGQRLAAMLREMPVRRLTIIPHAELHLVPFWALPSLANYQVMQSPSAAQFLAARREPRRLEPRALVVGNPTEDLTIAAVEAECVADRLGKNGWTVDLIEEADATEAAITQRIAGASILHFSGHGRSDLAIPIRSALEVNPGSMGQSDEGEDLLIKLAAQADWQRVYHLAGTEWIDNHNERWADISGRGRLERRFYPRYRCFELRLQYSAKGTLAGQYEWVDDDEEGGSEYGERHRLCELWTAGDILTEGSLRDCDFAFLSSCEAGAGGASFFVDEFAGLPAALQLAGVATLVSPLWPVRVDVAAIFADLFYRALTTKHGEVDMLALVHRTQQRLRQMNRDQADTALAELSKVRKSARARLLLDKARQQIRTSEEEYPFAHPYDWAAFQVTGAPTLVMPVTGSSETEADIPDSFTVAEIHEERVTEPPIAPEPVKANEETAVIKTSGRSGEAFELGDAAELLLERTGDERLKPIAAKEIFERGLAHQRVKDEARAFADFARAVELDPTLTIARIRLGQLYAIRRDYELALAQYEAALALEPDNSLTLLSIGFTHRALNNAEAAISSFNQVLALQAGEDHACSAQKALGEIYLEAGQYEQAITELTEVLTSRPEEAFCYLQRSLAYEGQEQPTEAVADCNRALMFLPNSATAYYFRGRAWRLSEDFSRAVADFSRSLELDPSSTEVIYNRGLAYNDWHEYARAIADFDRAITQEPERPEIYSDRGLAYMYLGECERAIADHTQALSLKPDFSVAFYNRACAYSMKQEQGSLVTDLTAALQGDPSILNHARSDPDLEWARQSLPELRTLLVFPV